MSMEQVEKLAGQYSRAHASLVEKITALEDIVQRVQRKKLPFIKRAVAEVLSARADLQAAIESSPEDFTKPRTRILHGVRVGYRKGTGSLDWDDGAKVVELIEKHFADQADVLINTTKKPNKEALELLDGKDLKRLGVTVEADGDVIVIKPVDGDVDKIVKALLKSDAKDEIRKAA